MGRWAAVRCSVGKRPVLLNVLLSVGPVLWRVQLLKMTSFMPENHPMKIFRGNKLIEKTLMLKAV